MSKGRSFPVGLRAIAVLSALLALAWYAPTASANPPTSQQDVQNAKSQYENAVARVRAIQSEIAVIQARLQKATAQVEKQQQLLEQITAELLQTRARITETQERYDKILAQLNERAVQAFISGPASNLDWILGATSLVDLSDRVEFVDAVSQSDADLAAQVEYLHQQLLFDEARLETLQAERREKLAQAKAIQDQIIADLQRVQDLQVQATQIAEQYFQRYRSVKKDRAEDLRALAQQAQAGSHHDTVPLPERYQHILKVCPVRGTSYYSDGFGAPRYGGGYHLHAGVDLVTARGTPIVAPFDGVARTSYNTLGGNAVYVTGRDGYVYNAHLDSYSSKSNGPVNTGDVIGYVGDTGDAIGTPHDHFEFHPFFPVPPDWPVSYYGYRVIGSGSTPALNPYPLLVYACG
jgi:murein DD-endopeptidase MepM/ murein hydrolase activator NlpD